MLYNACPRHNPVRNEDIGNFPESEKIVNFFINNFEVLEYLDRIGIGIKDKSSGFTPNFDIA